MNMNAVRASHYPPDKSFLEACDELGLYVLDELAGWHDAYDTAIGRRLVREMVERDVNHPSILFWDNGNEGGWNSALDRVFGGYDIQNRPVLRPDVVASGIDTQHYLDWEELTDKLEDWPSYKRFFFGEPPLVMPTELLHGLYDGGSGASLGEYWRTLRASPRVAGAFLWALTDEAVVRTDRDGELDTDGNHAPDGVVGPYRQLSGTYHAVREAFSPVVLVEEGLLEDFDGTITVENRFDFLGLDQVRFRWAWVSVPGPEDPDPALVELESGELDGPSTPPGERGRLRVPLSMEEQARALRLNAFDPQGREVASWVWPRPSRRALAASFVSAGEGTVTAREEDTLLRLRAAPDDGTEPVEAVFDLGSGTLRTLTRGGESLELDGPRPLPANKMRVDVVRHWADGDAHTVEVRYERGLGALRWKFHPSGWLRLTYELRSSGKVPYFGVGFPVPDDDVRGFEWLGHGPARIWRNRREGGELKVWNKRRAEAVGPTWAHEPVFAGYYGDVYWAKIEIGGSTLGVVLPDELVLGVGKITFPEDSKDAVAAVPPGGLAILNGISAIGTKFHSADELGPQGQPHRIDGTYRGTVWLK